MTVIFAVLALFATSGCGKFGFYEPQCQNGQTCDDGDPCTTADICADGRCIGQPIDEDGDGFIGQACGGLDCDDDNSLVFPGAEERCGNEVDDDCDGLTDLMDPDCDTASCSADGWCLQATPAGALDLEAVYGFSSDDVWVAGEGGFLMHYNGADWDPVDSGSSETLRALGGVSADELWAVGDSGTVICIRNGLAEDFSPTTGEDLLDLQVWDSEKLTVVGSVGSTASLFNRSLGEWQAIDSGSMDFDLRGIWGIGTNSIWVVGASDQLWNNAGTGWNAMHSGGGFVRWHAICGIDDSHLYWVGSHGHRGYRDEGTWASSGWSPAAGMPTLFGVWCETSPFRAWVVGEQGTIWIDELGTLIEQDSGVNVDLNAIWSDGLGHFVAVGAGGTVLFK